MTVPVQASGVPSSVGGLCPGWSQDLPSPDGELMWLSQAQTQRPQGQGKSDAPHEDHYVCTRILGDIQKKLPNSKYGNIS